MAKLAFSVIAAYLALSEHSCSCSFSTGGGASGGHHSHYLGAFILAGFGLLLFWGGFQNYRRLRLLADTPRMPIRSLAMGRVHILGKATGTEHVTSPLTHLSCFYYVVKVERWEKDSKGRGQWSICLRHVEQAPFFIEDATGRVRINPHQAQLDLPQTFRAETGVNASRSRTVDPSVAPGIVAADSDLVAYFTRTHAAIHAEMAAQNDSSFKRLINMDRSASFLPAVLSPNETARRLRFTEECLLPDREYNILGTCAENPNAAESSDRHVILRGENETTFIISSKTEKALEKETRGSSLLLILIGGVLLIGAAAVLIDSLGLW